MSLSIKGLRKGIFLTIYANSLELNIDNKPALGITGFSAKFKPLYLLHRELAVALKGRIGTGTVDGIMKLPLLGTIKINRAELSAIPYLTRFGLDMNGNLTSEIYIKDETAHVSFMVPDLLIKESALSVVPFLNTFRKTQGALSVRNNSVIFDSVSLEGEKGYARLKGDITNGMMNLALEIMPYKGQLNKMETMVIGKYILSPGYYVIPIVGPVR